MVFAKIDLPMEKQEDPNFNKESFNVIKRMEFNYSIFKTPYIFKIPSIFCLDIYHDPVIKVRGVLYKAFILRSMFNNSSIINVCTTAKDIVPLNENAYLKLMDFVERGYLIPIRDNKDK